MTEIEAIRVWHNLLWSRRYVSMQDFWEACWDAGYAPKGMADDVTAWRSSRRAWKRLVKAGVASLQYRLLHPTGGGLEPIDGLFKSVNDIAPMEFTESGRFVPTDDCFVDPVVVLTKKVQPTHAERWAALRNGK